MEYLSVKKVKNNPDNPRTITDDNFKKLVKSIKDFPKMLELRPLVVDENMVVLGGNMRLKACIEAGLKKVPVLSVVDLTDKQKKEFIIKDNVGFGDWDWANLGTDEWKKEDLKEWGLAIWGEDEAVITEGELSGIAGNFDDEGIIDNSQYGVIVMCKNSDEQQKFFEELSNSGYECKIVVT